MKLLYFHEFIEELERLDKKVQQQIKVKLKELHRTPAGAHTALPLKGEQFKGLYKLRVGDWRLIYKLDQGALVFITLGHRSDVYER
jgi:mRNA interferase RelE/StbE